jgi:hypothetical protein
MWLPKQVFDQILSLGPRLEAIERELRVLPTSADLASQTLGIEKLALTVDRAAAHAAEIVALKIADEVHEFGLDTTRLAALEAENGALRARVVQQETTIKLLLTQLELFGARETQLIGQLGVRLHLPVQSYVPGAPTMHPVAPAGVTDAQGVPVSTPADADAAMKLLAATIRATSGGSAPAPDSAGTPGELPVDMFADLDDVEPATGGNAAETP